MTAHPFDGTDDAPRPMSSLCVEVGCGLPREARIHRDPDGHFFNAREPLLNGRVRGEVVAEPEREVADPELPPYDPKENDYRRHGDPRRCSMCGQLRRYHRGKLSHKFEPLEAGRTTATPAQVVRSFQSAIERHVTIGNRLRTKSVTIEPVYAVDNDQELLSATVQITAVVTFRKERDEV